MRALSFVFNVYRNSRNDGAFFPTLRATYTNPKTPIQNLNDGAYWYLKQPANRWTNEGSPNKTDAIEIRFGIERPVDSLKLYFLEDQVTIAPPEQYTIAFWNGSAWQDVTGEQRVPARPEGHRPNIVTFAQTIHTSRFRIALTHRRSSFTGLTEIEAWGHARLPLSAPTKKIDDLAFNPGDRPLPRASASFTSQFDRIEEINDGKVFFSLNSRNRWTAYGSPNESDWVQIDLDGEHTIGRLDIDLWGDNGGVRAPKSYTIQYWKDHEWANVTMLNAVPQRPTVAMVNSVDIFPVSTTKIRLTFLHSSPGRTGVTELMVWEH